MLKEREPPPRLEPVDQEAHADAPEEPFLPALGAHDLHVRSCRFHQSPLVRQLCPAKYKGRRGDLSIYLQDTYVRSKTSLPNEAARRARGADAQADHREHDRAARGARPRTDLDQRYRR